MDPFLIGTHFYAIAIMDLTQEPESVRYSPSNMKTVLFNLHPRPKVFITGAAISPEITQESIAVWDEYVQQTRRDDTLVINTQQHSTSKIFNIGNIQKILQSARQASEARKAAIAPIPLL
ncbi:MAG: hypothetical protein Q9167_006270 [Letrouitia subvulpina]